MNGEATRAPVSARAAGAPNLMGLMTRARCIEVARIGVTGLVALLFWRGLVPIQWLWVAVAVGLYPLVKTGYLDLVREHKVGTEIFVTVATLVAVFGGETVAGAVLMVITLMIFTSPAELGLATPLVMIAAIARAARSGILIKGGIHLEALAKVDVMVFDTTGTLTANRPQVVEVYSRAPCWMRTLCSAWPQPRTGARRILSPRRLSAQRRKGASPCRSPKPLNNLPGRGAKAFVDGRLVLVGNSALLRESGVEIPTAIDDTGRTPVCGCRRPVRRRHF